VVTVEDVCAFDPLASGGALPLPLADPFAPAPAVPGVLGAQAQLWTEFLPEPGQVLYAAYPRLCAFAEAAWSSGPRDYAGFRARLARQAPLLVDVGALGAERLAGLGADPGSGPGERRRPARIEV
jgi:hexosaminidase